MDDWEKEGEERTSNSPNKEIEQQTQREAIPREQLGYGLFFDDSFLHGKKRTYLSLADIAAFDT